MAERQINTFTSSKVRFYVFPDDRFVDFSMYQFAIRIGEKRRTAILAKLHGETLDGRFLERNPHFAQQLENLQQLLSATA